MRNTKASSPELIKEQYEKLEKYSEKFFGDRHENVMTMFDALQERIITSPASTHVKFHNAFQGGWLDHTLRVIENSIRVYKLYEGQEGVDGFTLNEVIFSAMFHDLGKLGDLTEPLYVNQNSDWHRQKGMVYKRNPNLNFMKVPDRALFLLQSFSIPYTENEMLGIKLSDGLFDESNKGYFINYNDGGSLKTTLPVIIHQADWMSSTIEGHKVTSNNTKSASNFKNLLNKNDKE